MNTSSEPKTQLPSISALVSRNEVGLFTDKSKKSDSCSGFIPKRFIFTCIGFLATSTNFVLTTNLNFAIVYMMDRSNTTVTRVQTSNECLANIHHTELEVNNETAIKGNLYWSPQTEGLALAAIFYGQVVGFVPGGRLAETFGGRRMLFTAFLLSSIFTFLLPVAATYSVHVFIICRFLLGAAKALVHPAVFILISRWTPQKEHNLTASIALAGYGFGAFVAFLAGGALCASTFLGGWPSVFYLSGLLCFAMSFLVYMFIYDTPNDHPNITSSELNYISSNMGSTRRKKIKRVQWKSMFSSLPFWALIIGYFGQTWILGMFILAQPMYMGTILSLESIVNGKMSCLPQLLKVLLSIACGYPLDWAVKKGYITVSFVRKGSTMLNSGFCCIGLVGVLFAGCDPTLNAIFFTVGCIASDFFIFGVAMNCVDIAPNLSGTVSGITSASSSIPYFIIPSLIGWLTKEERSMAQWRYVYYWSIGVIAFTTMIFVIFGTSDPQPWGSEDKEEPEDEKNENVGTRL